MPKYENPGKKIQFYDKIIPAGAEIRLLMPPRPVKTDQPPPRLTPPPGQPGPGSNPLMRIDPTRQIHLSHLVIMILQLMHTQRIMDLPMILPIPHLKLGKIPFFG
jgi:hypothetical protein